MSVYLVYIDLSLILLGIYAFVILKDGIMANVGSIAEDLKDIVKKKIAAFALPNQFLVIIITPHPPPLSRLPWQDLRIVQMYTFTCI